MTISPKLLRFGAVAAVCTLLFGCERQAGQSPDSIAYFAADQATAGKALFDAHCSSCHSVDVGQPSPAGLKGTAFVSRWRSANDLYLKIANTMPANRLLSLSRFDYENVTAYLLSLNGIDAGERRFDSGAARRVDMLLPHSVSATPPVQGRGYYTAAQAQRGKGYFEGSCGLCHVAAPAPGDDGTSKDPFFATATLDPNGGIVGGNTKMKLHLAGPSFIAKWPSVGALVHRVESTMPGSYPGQIDRQTIVDIVAYLLSVNGLPPGKAELTYAPHSNAAMPILEEGFASLFDGQDFRNFRFLRGQGCGLPPDGCGDIRPGDTFTIRDRTISNSGSPYGALYTSQRYLNFDLRLDYRFPPEKDADLPFYGNSGYLLFVDKPQIWPRSIEIEGQEQFQLAVLPLDAKAVFTWDADAFQRARKPLGQWNSVRIVSRDGLVKSYLNGILLSQVRHQFAKPGHIMFQSEGAPIFWRNIRIRSFDSISKARR